MLEEDGFFLYFAHIRYEKVEKRKNVSPRCSLELPANHHGQFNQFPSFAYTCTLHKNIKNFKTPSSRPSEIDTAKTTFCSLESPLNGVIFNRDVIMSIRHIDFQKILRQYVKS